MIRLFYNEIVNLKINPEQAVSDWNTEQEATNKSISSHKQSPLANGPLERRVTAAGPFKVITTEKQNRYCYLSFTDTPCQGFQHPPAVWCPAERKTDFFLL